MSGLRTKAQQRRRQAETASDWVMDPLRRTLLDQVGARRSAGALSASCVSSVDMMSICPDGSATIDTALRSPLLCPAFGGGFSVLVWPDCRAEQSHRSAPIQRQVVLVRCRRHRMTHRSAKVLSLASRLTRALGFSDRFARRLRRWATGSLRSLDPGGSTRQVRPQ